MQATTCQTCYGSGHCFTCNGSGKSDEDSTKGKITILTSAVNELEQLFRHDPMAALSFAEAQDIKHSVARLEIILKEH